MPKNHPNSLTLPQNLDQLQNIFTTPNNYPAIAVAFSPGGSLLAVGLTDNTIKILEANSGKEVTSLVGHTNWARSVAFSPDGSFLASGSDDDTVKIWRTADFSLVASLEEHISSVNSVAFSPAGDFLASGSSDKTVKIWRTADFSLVASLEEHTSSVNSVAFSPAGDFLASGSADYTVKIWRTADFSLVASLEENASTVFSVAFSPAGDFLASGSYDRTVKIWRTNDFSLVASLEQHTDIVYSVAFSPAGDFLASGSKDNMVKIWHANDAYSLHKTIAGTDSNDCWITLVLKTIVSRNGGGYYVTSVAFHPAGTSLALANTQYDHGYRLSGGVVSLWGTASGQAVFCPAGCSNKPEFSILFPTANQEVKGQSLALQLQSNNADDVEYSVSASGTALTISYQQQTTPNTAQKVLVNLEVEIAPELQGRNIILEVKAKNSAGESVQYMPLYFVPPAP